MAGTKFNSIFPVCSFSVIEKKIFKNFFKIFFQISPVEHMEPTTLKRWEFKSMQIAELGGFTFLIDFTLKMNFQRNLNYTFPYKINKNKLLKINGLFNQFSWNETYSVSCGFPSGRQKHIIQLSENVFYEFFAEFIILRIEPADQRWVNCHFFRHLISGACERINNVTEKTLTNCISQITN